MRVDVVYSVICNGRVEIDDASQDPQGDAAALVAAGTVTRLSESPVDPASVVAVTTYPPTVLADPTTAAGTLRPQPAQPMPAGGGVVRAG